MADPERRQLCEWDPYLFLPTYFSSRFYNPFTDAQREMIRAILHCAQHGGDQSLAAPRGDGKTTLAECVIIFCLLVRLRAMVPIDEPPKPYLRFPLITAATGPDAKRILNNIKFELEFNDTLAEDFPEVCTPIRELEGAPQRASKQTIDGEPTRIKWSNDIAVFPTVPGSYASGSVLMTRGLDASIRGIRWLNLRPDLCLVDDPETRESARSELQIQTREQTLDRDIAGLGGQGKKIARVVLCTIQNRNCLAYKLTDPKQKPSWGGKRFALMVTKPTREELWEEYMDRRRAGQEAGTDRDGRGAMQFYADNREAMEAGAVLGNPHRFIRDLLPDGTPQELSALQHCYNIICDRGLDSFLTECNNDPPLDNGPQESGITDVLVRSRLNGRPKRVAPAGTLKTTGFIDIGEHGLHWGFIAWQIGATGSWLDYGFEDVHSAGKDDRGIDKAIINALHRVRERMLREPFLDDDGKPRLVDLVPIDTGHRDTAVLRFLEEVGGLPFRASKGFGEGPRSSPFRASAADTPDRKIGNHWADAKQKKKRYWLFEMDADHWKRFVHDRFKTPTFNEDLSVRRGSLSFWGDNAKDHFSISKHIVAEVEREEFVPGKGRRRVWHVKSPSNHWLDVAYGNCAAADFLGVSLFDTLVKPEPAPRPATSWYASRQRRRA